MDLAIFSCGITLWSTESAPSDDIDRHELNVDPRYRWSRVRVLRKTSVCVYPSSMKFSTSAQ